MRLIDGDSLKADLRQYFTDGVLDGISARLAFNQILHDIDNAPTIDVVKAFNIIARGKSKDDMLLEIMKIENLKKGDYVLVKCKVESVFVDSGLVMVSSKDCDEGFDAYIDEIVDAENEN